MNQNNIVAQNPLVDRRDNRDASRISRNPPVEGRQLELFAPQCIRHKRQITSIPGISPKERHRYRVLMGDRILGDRLTLDEAIALAKPVNSKSNNPSHS